MKPYYTESANGRELTIYHGDCREVLPDLGIYDLVLTDPPYGVGLEYDNYEDSDKNFREVVLAAFSLIKISGVVTLITPGNSRQYDYPKPDWTLGWFFGPSYPGPWGMIHWQPILAYGKDPYLREAEGCYPDAIVLADTRSRFDHPCPKPVKFWSWLLKRGAPRPTDKILDPFLGSGTTLYCAKQLGHSAIGIEQSEKYCEIAANRLRQDVLF